MKRLLTILIAAATLGACGDKTTPVPDETPPAAPTAAQPQTSSSTAELQKAASEAQEATTTAPEPAADTPAVERMVGMPESAQLPGGRWKAGVNYVPIVPAQGTNVEPGQVEIIEFLWLACGACYSINEHITAYKAKLPAWVKFRQEHVMWGPSHAKFAKLLYTLQALGRDDLIAKAFQEIHDPRKRNMLGADQSSDADTLRAQLAFALANGVSEADFKREYNGFGVSTRLKAADELTRRYRVEGTPTFIVNGKYMTGPDMAGGPQKLLELLNDLAAAEKR